MEINTFFYIFGSIFFVSLISLIGIISFLLKDNFQKIILFLVSFSTGALFGGAMLHLLPEALETIGSSLIVGIYFLCGILFFFIVEKIIHWRHCHIKTSKEHPHHLGKMNLIGDSVHNLIDGMIIAGAYISSIPLGITTTIGIIAHEIPQEIGDFGVLIYSKYTKKKALFYNFLTACSAFVGAILALILGNKINGFSNFIVAFAAGGFIYIAGSDLIPELKKESKISQSLLQLLGIILGILIMIFSLLLE